MKENKKSSPLLIFAMLLILGGVLLMLYPIVGDYLANRERSKAITQYDNVLKKMTDKDIEKQLKLIETYNKSINKRQNGLTDEAGVDYKSLANIGQVMGTLDVPALDIKEMPFYHGTDYKTLDRGLGHFESSSIPIGGKNTRSIITGHSGVQNQVLFTDIKQLKEGDIFFINILGKRLSYQIESFEEILPTEAEKVKIVKNKDMVTLLTCTPPGINTYRLLVNGVRIPYEEALKTKVAKRNLFSYKNIVLISLLVCALIFILLFTRYYYLNKKQKSEDPLDQAIAASKLRRLFFIIKSFFITLVIVIITVLIVAILGYLNVREQQELEPIEIGQKTELSHYNLAKISKAKYTEKDISSVNITNFSESKINFKKTVNDWGVGKIMIPDVQIDLPILAGMTNINLMSGAATYREKQQLGKSNYVLLAHNVYDQDLLLHRIVNMQKKTKIYATDFKDLYIYETFYNEVVRSDRVDLLEEESPDKKIITLIRCEGDIGTPYRRVVQGELTNIQPLSSIDNKKLEEFGMNRAEKKTDGKIVKKSPVNNVEAATMSLASVISGNPLQTMVPILLLLVIPILFLNIIR